jgi:two-component system, OmpR family, sensor histidine kinase KdpD
MRTESPQSDHQTKPLRPAAARLLQQLEAGDRPKRGRLTVYLGAAPGVGKTYAMLHAAHRLKAEGIDVVAGFVETHNRAETADAIGDLERIPRKRVEYKGVALEEMDVDAILDRKPAVCLVDELAHTNVPGSQRKKRWKDVEAIRDAGIDVIATLNIQHLESLHMAVESITGVAVRETIPDTIVDHADQVELIDISPEALRHRLERGLIYPPDRARAAMSSFFRTGNLNALRELALRRTAKEVQDQLEAYLAEHRIAGSWPATDRVMVAIDHRPIARDLLRTAWRLGQALRADCIIAVTIVDRETLDPVQQKRLRENLTLAEDLGIETHELRGAGSRLAIGDALVQFAREHQVTQLVLGQSARNRFQILLKGSVINHVLRHAAGIDLYIVADRTSGKASPRGL